MLIGWGSRTRTYACQNQNLVPYRLGDTPTFCGMPAGIRTPDPRLRRAMLYPAELQTHIRFGAGEGDRTLATGLEGQGSTTELHPHSF